MRVLIIEDEPLAAEKLERYLKQYDASIDILAVISSVAESVRWLKQYEEKTDLIFMDIQLYDGLSFDIFTEIRVQRPIIFTTSYDQYTLDAFKVNSIDYLLKPITYTELSRALQKVKNLESHFSSVGDVQKIINNLSHKKFKDRFLVQTGERIDSIDANDIAFFYAEGRTVFLVTIQSRKYVIDYRLEEIEGLVEPASFFRINRSFIVNINAIEAVIIYSSSRLKIDLKSKTPKDLITSRERVADFKKWYGGDL